MAIQFPDLNPTPTSNDKVPHVKVVKLVFGDFVTGGTASVKAVLPADASILGMDIWYKTKPAGGGVTAVTLSVGTAAAPTQFVNALDVLTPASGAYTAATPITNILQPYGLPFGSDIALLFTGTATTGNPTSGEMYVLVRYVR